MNWFRKCIFNSIFLRQLPLKRPFQNRLPVGFKLCLRDFKAFDPFIQTAEQLFYFGNNAVLFGEGGRRKMNFLSFAWLIED